MSGVILHPLTSHTSEPRGKWDVWEIGRAPTLILPDKLFSEILHLISQRYVIKQHAFFGTGRNEKAPFLKL